MNLRSITILVLVAVAAICIGCSGGTQLSPVTPGEGAQKNISAANSHSTWGLWQFTADPIAGTLEVAQLRTGNFHLNALPFLEPPLLVNLTLESLAFNGNIIDANIGLRHPFLGLTEFTGFDVCGLLISNGSVTGFSDTALRMAGTNETRLLNPDGYSRWWNPAEFPANGTMLGYKDGLLGAPDSTANFNCTLNGYKYFCNDITNPDDPLSVVTQANRGLFSAGQKNIRHYKIELGTEGLIFNYAVDASWTFPNGSPPWTAPDSFPPEANRPEAWRADVTETNNTLWNDGAGGSGGDLSLSINLFDRYNAQLNAVTIESPGNFSDATAPTPVGGGADYSTYEIDITGATPAQGSIDILIEAGCEAVGYGGLLPGKTVTAYFIHTASVEPTAPVEVDPYYDGVCPSGTTDDPLPTEWWMEFDGSAHSGSSYEWDFSYDGIIFNTEGTGKFAAHKYDYVPADNYPITYDVALRVNGVGGNIYIYPTVVARGVYVDGFNGSSVGSGAMTDPLNTIINGVFEAQSETDDVDGSIVMVRGDDGVGGQLVYNEVVGLTSVHAGLGLQGYSLDTVHYKTPAMRNFTPPPGSYPWSECIYVVNADGVRVDGFEFDNIRGTDPPGGYWEEYAAVVSFTDSDNVRVSHTFCHNIFTDNSYWGWKPGYHIKLENCNNAVVTNNLFYDGVVASDWGTVDWLYAHLGSNLTVANNTVDQVDESPNTGAWWVGYTHGVGLYETTSAEVVNTLITNLTGIRWESLPYGGGWGVISSTNTNPIFDYSDVWNIRRAYGYPPSVSYGPDHRFEGDVTEGANCINPGSGFDPLFVSGHHLDTGSPCINSGDPGILDNDGSVSDIGCYGGPGGDWYFED